jgi:FkbM family methyltransferase
VSDRYPDLTFIDIGANVGDTVVIVRRQAAVPVLCIEGDPMFFRLLNENIGSLQNVELVQSFLDEVSGEVAGTLVSGRGTARMSIGAGTSILRTVSLPDLLKTYPQFRDSKLIKVDTDGMDFRILSGSRAVLASARPVLFFEYDPYLAGLAGADGRRLLKELRQIGYRKVMVYENTGDYVNTLDISNPRMVEDFDAFYSGRRGQRYADLCAFHEDDNDLWESVRSAERAYFSHARLAEHAE